MFLEQQISKSVNKKVISNYNNITVCTLSDDCSRNEHKIPLLETLKNLTSPNISNGNVILIHSKHIGLCNENQRSFTLIPLLLQVLCLCFSLCLS